MEERKMMNVDEMARLVRAEQEAAAAQSAKEDLKATIAYVAMMSNVDISDDLLGEQENGGEK
jgi:hypothetical protein